MDFTQRLADRAQFALRAFLTIVFGEAMRQDDGAVQGPDHLQRGNFLRRARQPVSAVGALLGDQKTGASKLLQDLRKQGQRDAVGLGNIFRRGACTSIAGNG